MDDRGLVLVWTGDGASDPVGEAEVLARAFDDRARLGQVLARMAELLCVTGDHDGAWLSEVCRLAGRGDEAWQYARQALDLARQQKERGNEAFALHQLGVVHAYTDPPDVAPAEAHYQQALINQLGQKLGNVLTPPGCLATFHRPENFLLDWYDDFRHDLFL